MSRLAKKPIQIPEGVTVTKDGNKIVVKGKLGELEREFRNEADVNVGEKEIQVTNASKSMFAKAYVGKVASHIIGMVEGVTNGFEKKLIIEGTGYKANVQGKDLVLSLGYSHDIPMTIPEGINVEVVKDTITITGINKEKVGQFASNIKSKRKPEPYKGKGVRYHDEVIERKQGKKAVA